MLEKMEKNDNELPNELTNLQVQIKKSESIMWCQGVLKPSLLISTWKIFSDF